MNLYTLSLAVTFGRGSRRPLRLASIKLGGLWIGAAIVGLLLSRNIPHLPAHGSALLYWGPSTIFVAQIITLFALLPAMGVTNPANDRLMSLLFILPVDSKQRERIFLLPSFVLACLGLTLSLPALAGLVLPTGINPVAFALCIAIGTTSAFTLIYARWQRWKYAQLLVACLMLFIEYKLVVHSHTSSGLTAAILFFGLTLSLCAVATQNGKALARRFTHQTASRPLWATSLPPQTWTGKKLFRSHTIMLGVVVALSLSGLSVFVACRQHVAVWDVLGTVAALLAASVASDTRGLARPCAPAEIVGLRGTRRFISALILPTYVVAYLAVLPTLITVSVLGQQDAAIALVKVTMGVSVGLFIGSLLSPGNRDISSQAATGLLCIAAIIAPAQLLPSNLGQTASVVLYVGLTVLMLLAAYLVEYKRNTYIWSRHAR